MINAKGREIVNYSAIPLVTIALIAALCLATRRVASLPKVVKSGNSFLLHPIFHWG